MGLDDKFDRRTFLKLGGLAVAATLVPAWLAGCTSAPPKKDTKKYVTINELHGFLIDENGDGKIERVIQYEPGDTVYLKDTIASVTPTGNESDDVPAARFPNQVGEIRLGKDVQWKQYKTGDLVIITIPILPAGTNYELYQYSYEKDSPILDVFNTAGKNTIRKA